MRSVQSESYDVLPSVEAWTSIHARSRGIGCESAWQGQRRPQAKADTRRGRTSNQRHGTVATSNRTLSQATGIPTTVLWRYVATKWITPRASYTRPLLSDQHKKDRVDYCKRYVEPLLDDMYDCVHVDEKWFYVTRTKIRFYLWPDEELPHRCVENKGHIEKVMFLYAVARPREGWNGKVGCWEITDIVTAKRTSKNRPAGTPLAVPTTINREKYRSMLMQHVLPAIQSRWIWPSGFSAGTIWIQQDNARSHVLPNDSLVLAAGKEGSWDIRLRNQPAKSPDLNVLDLGFFNSIQSLQHKKECRNTEDLMLAVKDAFNELDPVTLTKTFKTLQRVMKIVIEVNGSNSFKIPRSKDQVNQVNEDDQVTLQLLDLRLEDEDRLSQLCALFESCDV
ncbi:hypothetical protein Ae201684P_020332 [Aphanomyces euteiches]|uniref:Transposase Tc1-like domain-containing protein n=1 Tax=Aphanomyces euteiches TaxID=100861 RepID=A0A6G0WC47_9STRA|nr:hypothetical protein Ae201684_016601 [Aphanomyces euteiches]KAH9084072.1 hypothetical protein Ae201684P_020332 [Aphanomyces euteiches]KAH9153517.1 hypothetical protein AeRB84_004247 [Aphanomyces euteiches]